MNNRDLREQLLNKHMSRKQFLQYLAGAAILALGLKNFISLFTNYQNPALQEGEKSSRGFGSSKFGA